MKHHFSVRISKCFISIICKQGLMYLKSSTVYILKENLERYQPKFVKYFFYDRESWSVDKRRTRSGHTRQVLHVTTYRK